MVQTIEIRLFICYLILGGLVGSMGKDLQQLGDEGRNKTSEYRKRTSALRTPSFTKKDEPDVGLSKNVSQQKITVKEIGLLQQNTYFDAYRTNRFRRYSKHVNNLTDTKECEMKVHYRTLNAFVHLIGRYESNYVFLGLQPSKGSGITIRSNPDVVDGNTWIWTFKGKDGAVEFLRWPVEFGVWSIGMLYQSVLQKPIVPSVVLTRVSGDCSNLTVGNVKDDLVISKALNAITLGLMSNYSDGAKFGASFFCYIRKRSIHANAM
ncbi:uncharacterized protein LOC128206349 [Mya arenaria]|uniref:uncharacterized protein LOC128206349 n=1 Tax=Mya arenaria TaxID=6604 RepID=UPI0022E839D8|nr:uncharacterized protein LOC128206349 [Mya arenaria]